jgi:hypothetical protein
VNYDAEIMRYVLTRRKKRQGRVLVKVAHKTFEELYHNPKGPSAATVDKDKIFEQLRQIYELGEVEESFEILIVNDLLRECGNGLVAFSAPRLAKTWEKVSQEEFVQKVWQWVNFPPPLRNVLKSIKETKKEVDQAMEQDNIFKAPVPKIRKKRKSQDLWGEFEDQAIENYWRQKLEEEERKIREEEELKNFM